MKYEINQKLEVFGLPVFSEGLRNYNGEIVIVKALPGYRSEIPNAYGVLFKDGVIRGAIEQYLRPALPDGRGDMDTPSTWEQFQAATGIAPESIKRSNPDY